MKKIDAIQPAYFSRFSCLGPECQYHCCQEWGIWLSRSEYTKIKSQIHSREMEEAFCSTFVRRKEKEGDDNKYASVHYNHAQVCPLQNQEGFCSLQLKCGHGALPNTCQIFPRTEAFFMGAMERHLSLGCEGVVKLLLEEKGGICLETHQISPNRGIRVGLYLTKKDAENRPVYQHVWDIKTLCTAVLQDRSHSLDDRMLLLGIMMGQLHRMEQESRTDQIPAFVDEILRSDEEYLNLKEWETIKIDPSVPIANALIFLNQLKAVSYNSHLIHMVEELLAQFQIVTKPAESETDDDPNTVHFTMNLEKNQEIKEKWKKWLAQYDYFVENIMVAWFFQEQLPFSKKDCSIWEHYIYFCSLYNLLKIILMGTVADPDWKMDQVVHNVTVCARTITHSSSAPQLLMKRAVDSESDTLAHMAVLIKS